MIARVFRQWDDWWCKPVPPHALALVRIAFGAFLLACFLFKAGEVRMAFSREGLLLPYREWLASGVLAPLFQPSPLLAWFLYGALLLSLLCFTLGFAMRAAGLLAWMLYLYEWMLSLHLFLNSFDRLFLLILLVLALSGADRTLSARMRRTHGSWLAWEPVSILPQRLLAAQITATYFGVAIVKLLVPAWAGGEILPYSFVSAWGTPLARWFVRLNLPLWFYDAAVFLVKCFEFFLPFGLWSTWRWWFFAGGLLFHVSIGAFLNIWWFVILVPSYVVFLDPDAVRAWVERQAKRMERQ